MKLILRPGVQAEIAEAASWYKERGTLLREAFLGELDEAFARVRRNPRLYPEFSQSVRRAPVRRFPYGIFFFVRDERIEVIAVVHDARHPTVWSHRI